MPSVEQWSRYHDDHQPVVSNPRLERDQEHFAATWSLSLEDQGFPVALTRLSSRIAEL